MTETSVSGATPCMRFDMAEANRDLCTLVEMAETNYRIGEAMATLRDNGESLMVITKTKVIGGEFWVTYALHSDLLGFLR